MFTLKKDFADNGYKLKKGDYTKEKLIKIYGSEERFNFCFACTSLKDVLVVKEEKKKTLGDKIKNLVTGSDSTEGDSTEVNIVYLINENIKKGRKIAFRKDQQVSYVEIEEVFGEKTEEIINSDKVTETKVMKKDV